MEFKATINAEQDIEDRSVTGFAAITGNTDSYYDIIHSGAFRKSIKENSARIRHLWMHDAYNPPIAAITELKEVKAKDLPEIITSANPEVTGGLKVTRTYLDTPRAEEVFAGIKAGVISEMSIGYDAVKWDWEEKKDDDRHYYVRNLREVRLWDTSDVTWGANGLTVAASKAAISFKSTGIAPEDLELDAEDLRLERFTSEAWDDLAPEEKARISSHYLYGTGDFEALQGLHHKPEEKGTGPAVFSAVKLCMEALIDGSGEINDSDLYSVYSHLAKHYQEFGKTAPDFSTVALLRLSASVKFAPAALILNHNLNEAQAEKANSMLAELRDLLTAEPPKVDAQSKALTEALLLKLATYERNPYIRL